jgi:hypothetical protein
MLGYIISDKKSINPKNYEIQSFNILCKTHLNIFVVKHNKVLYMNNIIINSTKYGHIEVLKWYVKSYNIEIYRDIELQYEIFITASTYGHVKIIDWLKNIKFNKDLYIPYYNICQYASHNGHVQILEWLKNEDKIKYNRKLFDTCFYKILNFFVNNNKVKKVVKWHNEFKSYKFLITIKFKTKNNYIKGYNKN